VIKGLGDLVLQGVGWDDGISLIDYIFGLRKSMRKFDWARTDFVDFAG